MKLDFNPEDIKFEDKDLTDEVLLKVEQLLFIENQVKLLKQQVVC